jgi:hypothetical protein
MIIILLIINKKKLQLILVSIVEESLKCFQVASKDQSGKTIIRMVIKIMMGRIQIKKLGVLLVLLIIKLNV